MLSKTTAPAEDRGRESTSGQDHSKRSRASRTSRVPKLGERIEYECPFCFNDADATFKEWRGCVEWQVGCRKPDCDGRHLPSLAEELGLNRYAPKEQIVAVLRNYGRPGRSRTGPPPKLPTPAAIDKRIEWLREEPDALAYLTDERGLSLDVIEALRIGFDGTHLTFPMYRDGELVAMKRRKPRPGAKMLKPFNSGAWDWPLYPDPDPADGRTFVVEGELDAGSLLSNGLPATSVTGGVDQWKPEWAGQLAGLRVVVMFDVEFEDRAEQRAAALRAAGISARSFDLRRLGMTERNQDISDYLDRCGSVDRLRRVLDGPRIRKTRRSS
jgi:hypothetical protein